MCVRLCVYVLGTVLLLNPQSYHQCTYASDVTDYHLQVTSIDAMTYTSFLVEAADPV